MTAAERLRFALLLCRRAVSSQSFQNATSPSFARRCLHAGTDEKLPPGWQEAYSQEHGRTYYWHQTTRSTQWERPQASLVVPKVPDGWQAVYSKEQQRHYYWHKESGMTQWELPSDEPGHRRKSEHKPASSSPQSTQHTQNDAEVKTHSLGSHQLEQGDTKEKQVGTVHPLDQSQHMLSPEAIQSSHQHNSRTVLQPTPASCSSQKELHLDTLPEGWEAVYATDQSCYYFWQRSTGLVTWHHPSQPSGWSQLELVETDNQGTSDVPKKERRKKPRWRLILHSTALGEEIHGEDLDVVKNLLAHHPEAAEKIGVGIQSIKVDKAPAPYESTCCFWILRTDGSEIDFSARVCEQNKQRSF